MIRLFSLLIHPHSAYCKLRKEAAQTPCQALVDILLLHQLDISTFLHNLFIILISRPTFKLLRWPKLPAEVGSGMQMCSAVIL